MAYNEYFYLAVVGSVATRKYKDPLDRCVLCSDISLWAVWPPENIHSPLIGVLYVVIEVLYVVI